MTTAHEQINEQIIRQANATPDQEICGFIRTKAFGQPQAVQCKNLAQDPMRDFMLDTSTGYVDALRDGTLQGYYHSHPKGLALEHTESDMQSAEALGLPCWLYSHDTGKVTIYEPISFSMPLEGRPYMQGSADCYTLVRDYYRTILSIELPPIERPAVGQGHVRLAEILEITGAQRVTEPRAHDVLLMTCRSHDGRPNHIGVYVGDGRFLHQPINRLSGVDLWLGYWQRSTAAIYRHPLCSQPLHCMGQSVPTSAEPPGG